MLQTKRTEYSSINRIALSDRASLEEVDRPSPYLCDDNAMMTSEIGKHDCRSVLSGSSGC